MNAGRFSATNPCVLLFAALAMLARPTSIVAQTEPVARQPYDVHVVVLLADHRFLATELFQTQFPRDVAQQTRLALGDLARVDAAATHPLAEAIRRDGLDAALDVHEEVSGRRTWFFLVHFSDGRFHLQGRFFDGLTGLAGPPSLTVATSDRGRLAHLAARMIAEPFALVGTVASAKGESVELVVHGGQLAEGSNIRPGAVFALSRIAVESGKLRARRVPWAALEAKGPPTAGIVSCQFWHRFQENKLAFAHGVAYRALLLPTRLATLKLQVIDRESSQPLAGIVVKIGGGKRDIDLVTDAAGIAVSREKIEGLALVKLYRGATALAQFPLAIVDDRTIVCAVSAQPQADDHASLDVRRQQLVKRILETLQVVDQRFGEQRILLGQSLEASVDHARLTLALLDGEIAYVRGERDEIKQIAKKQNPSKQRHEEGDKGLARLTQLRGVVSESIGRIRQGIADRDVQTEKQKMAVKLVEQASLLESQAQYDEAIDNYQKAAALLPEPGKVGERLTILRAGWEIKNDAHRQARKFVVETWPKIDVAVIKEHLVGAQKALDVCRDVGDRLTPRRFLMANVDHLANISQVVEKLKRSRTAEDQQRVKGWRQIVETLRELSNQASEQAAPAANVDKK